MKSKRRFSVALSFAGENRPFIAQVADTLSQKIGKKKVFYDKYYEAELARPNLNTYLMQLYKDDSDLVAVFLCANYAEKDWCGVEWRVLLDMIKRKKVDEIMPFRFDNNEVEGFLSIDGYVSLDGKTPEDVAVLILDRLTTSRTKYYNPNATISRKNRFVFISRLLNPPGNESGSHSRVWVASDKECDIYIESIRVIHKEGMLSSVGTGKRHVDEKLKYSFRSGSDVTHELDPYLTIDRNERRELVFDLELTPEGHFGSIGGHVLAILNYHTSDGQVGQIPLIDQKGKKLFAQIEGNPIVDYIKINNGWFSEEGSLPYIINEKGLICGNDDIEQLPIFNFSFLDVNSWDYNETKKIENKDIVYKWYEKTKGKEELIGKEILLGNIYAVELSIFSSEKEIVMPLIKLADNNKYFHEVCRAIALSELLGIDRGVHDFIVKNIHKIKALRPSYYGDETAAIELLLLSAYLKDANRFNEIKHHLLQNDCYVEELEDILNQESS